MYNYEITKQYRIKNGETITIAIDEDEYSVIAYTEKGEKIGNIDFKDEDTHFYIKWMYLDQLSPEYTKNGIGRECLLLIKEVYGCILRAADDNGLTLDDGSHLTGNAPGFISKMRTEGIVE